MHSGTFSLLLFVLFGLLACQSKVHILTSQIWQLDAEHLRAVYESLLAPEEKRLAEQYPEKLERMERQAAAGFYRFEPDGTFLMSPDYGSTWHEAGRWQLNKKQLVIGKDTMRVESISPDKVVCYLEASPRAKKQQAVKLILLSVR